jgi:hypothetical protein
LFYTREQASGGVYVFRLGSQGKLELASLISPSPERGDISGFRFAPQTLLRSAVYDGVNMIWQMMGDGSVIRGQRVPGRDQKGLAVVSAGSRRPATIFVAKDSGEVSRYTGYPVACGREDEKPICGSADSRRASST